MASNVSSGYVQNIAMEIPQDPSPRIGKPSGQRYKIKPFKLQLCVSPFKRVVSARPSSFEVLMFADCEQARSSSPQYVSGDSNTGPAGIFMNEMLRKLL